MTAHVGQGHAEGVARLGRLRAQPHGLLKGPKGLGVAALRLEEAAAGEAPQVAAAAASDGSSSSARSPAARTSPWRPSAERARERASCTPGESGPAGSGTPRTAAIPHGGASARSYA